MPAKEPFDALRNLTDGPEASFQIEQTEIAAWKDLIDAASPQFKQVNGLQWQEIGGGLAINFVKMPVPSSTASLDWVYCNP